MNLLKRHQHVKYLLIQIDGKLEQISNLAT
jgi:hypothetical protein